MTFGFLFFCEREICSSEIFLGRMTNEYYSSVNILVLVSSNIVEISKMFQILAL